MPSPIGHALGGIAAGWAVSRPASGRRALIIQSAVLGVVAAAPDLDLLMSHHRAETHSLAAGALVATLAAWMRWPVASARSRIWWAIFAAWATHPLLDSLAHDLAPPFGIMAFWPLSSKYFQTGFELFLPTSRRWSLGFLEDNTLAAIRELLILTPICILTWWARRRPPQRT